MKIGSKHFHIFQECKRIVEHGIDFFTHGDFHKGKNAQFSLYFTRCQWQQFHARNVVHSSDLVISSKANEPLRLRLILFVTKVPLGFQAG